MENSSAVSDDGHALQRQLTRGIAGFLAVAVILRLVRAIQNYPMWCDETMLAANLLDRNWSELAQPLDYRQVCPLGFLAIEWIAVRLVGFSELALRLFPLCSSMASVPVFYGLTRHYLGRGTPGTFLAVALFAVSEPLIRYAGEAKPYESDLLVSLVLLCLWPRWISSPEREMGALADCGSGAAGNWRFVTIALHDWRDRHGRCLGIVQETLGLDRAAAGCICGDHGHFCRDDGRARAIPGFSGGPCIFPQVLGRGFPPSILDPAVLGGGCCGMSTGPLFAFPHGGDLRLAWLTPVMFGGCALGTIILLPPPASGCRACSSHSADSGCGGAAAISVRAECAGEFVPGSGRAHSRRGGDVVDLVQDSAGGGSRPDRDGVRIPPGAVRCLQTGQRPGASLPFALGPNRTGICSLVLGGDVGQRRGGVRAERPWDPVRPQALVLRRGRPVPVLPADLLPAASRGGLPQWDRVSAQHPLRCVLLSRRPEDVPGFAAWIETHRDRYTLKSVQSYPATRGSAVEPALVYVVCEFVPNEGAMAAADRMKLR